MRIWSIHPKYLDSKGFVALWREALLAKNVLEGKTVGYRSHPQLDRFKEAPNPLDAINQYLSNIYDGSIDRHFTFDSAKFRKPIVPLFLTVSEDQIIFEFEHLLYKLKRREINLYKTLKETTIIIPHPMFKTIKGKIEKWEKVK
ncbi:MAG: pyrimidine dimer DNA glycosylase/endonuclease V [Bacteroidetes bacterium]|nr:pyrimidine dimer DNA glycosylase/endonuclease V [Bacteroidota bacterium]